eukprot:snap_masked-scaffold_11-processed-gene-7.44-mRNA-1 protein AED:0.34 eAED:0.34 QI:113/0.5/0.33/1/1/1/3/0/1557
MGNIVESQPVSDFSRRDKVDILASTAKFQSLQFLKNLRSTGSFMKSCQCTSQINGSIKVVIKIRVNLPTTLADADSSRRINFFRDKIKTYLREINALYDVSKHPNLLPYQDYIGFQDCVFLIRQYIQYSLSDRLYTQPFLSFDEKLFVCYQIVKALEQLKSMNISHGSLHPNNIMLSSYNWVIVTDFSCYLKSTYTSNRQINQISRMGITKYGKYEGNNEACYMAPERFHSFEQALTNTESMSVLSNLASSDDEAEGSENTIDHSKYRSVDRRIKLAMDIFSAGCVFYDIFSHSDERLFMKPLYHASLPSSLSRHGIRLFEKVKLETAKKLNILFGKDESAGCSKIERDISTLIRSMVRFNPVNRRPLSRVLNKKEIFSSKLIDVIYPFMFKLQQLPSPEAKMTFLCENYSSVFREESKENLHWSTFFNSIFTGNKVNEQNNPEEEKVIYAEPNFLRQLANLRKSILIETELFLKKLNIPESSFQVYDEIKTEKDLEKNCTQEEYLDEESVESSYEEDPKYNLVIVNVLCEILYQAKSDESCILASVFLVRMSQVIDDDFIRMRRVLPYILQKLKASILSNKIGSSTVYLESIFRILNELSLTRNPRETADSLSVGVYQILTRILDSERDSWISLKACILSHLGQVIRIFNVYGEEQLYNKVMSLIKLAAPRFDKYPILVESVLTALEKSSSFGLEKILPLLLSERLEYGFENKGVKLVFLQMLGKISTSVSTEMLDDGLAQFVLELCFDSAAIVRIKALQCFQKWLLIKNLSFTATLEVLKGLAFFLLVPECTENSVVKMLFSSWLTNVAENKVEVLKAMQNDVDLCALFSQSIQRVEPSVLLHLREPLSPTSFGNFLKFVSTLVLENTIDAASQKRIRQEVIQFRDNFLKENNFKDSEKQILLTAGIIFPVLAKKPRHGFVKDFKRSRIVCKVVRNIFELQTEASELVDFVPINRTKVKVDKVILLSHRSISKLPQKFSSVDNKLLRALGQPTKPNTMKELTTFNGVNFRRDLATDYTFYGKEENLLRSGGLGLRRHHIKGKLYNTICDDNQAISALASSMDSLFFLTGSHSGSIRLYLTTSLFLSHEHVKPAFNYTSQPGRINDIAVIKNSHRIASGSSEGSLHIFDVNHVYSAHNYLKSSSANNLLPQSASSYFGNLLKQSVPEGEGFGASFRKQSLTTSPLSLGLPYSSPISRTARKSVGSSTVLQLDTLEYGSIVNIRNIEPNGETSVLVFTTSRNYIVLLDLRENQIVHKEKLTLDLGMFTTISAVHEKSLLFLGSSRGFVLVYDVYHRILLKTFELSKRNIHAGRIQSLRAKYLSEEKEYLIYLAVEGLDVLLFSLPSRTIAKVTLVHQFKNVSGERNVVKDTKEVPELIEVPIHTAYPQHSYSIFYEQLVGSQKRRSSSETSQNILGGSFQSCSVRSMYLPSDFLSTTVYAEFSTKRRIFKHDKSVITAGDDRFIKSWEYGQTNSVIPSNYVISGSSQVNYNFEKVGSETICVQTPSEREASQKFLVESTHTDTILSLDMFAVHEVNNDEVIPCLASGSRDGVVKLFV